MNTGYERFGTDSDSAAIQLEWFNKKEVSRPRILKFPIIVEAGKKILLLSYQSRVGTTDFRFPTKQIDSSRIEDTSGILSRHRGKATIGQIAVSYIGEYMFGWDKFDARICAVDPLYIYKGFVSSRDDKDFDVKEIPVAISVDEDPRAIHLSDSFVAGHQSLGPEPQLWVTPDHAVDIMNVLVDVTPEKFTFKRNTLLDMGNILDRYMETRTEAA